MGTVEVLSGNKAVIASHIITYGTAADAALTENIRCEIATLWNEPQGAIEIDGVAYAVYFKITAAYLPHITPEEILSNTNPMNNYFRIENYAQGNISFVDGLGCNTGYFKLENLYTGSTTAAHEYGHTLGLAHPADLDIRGKGVPGIMYPRGTLVDAAYQYDPEKKAGEAGGTLHPMHRKVKQEDIALLKINYLEFNNKSMALGDFSSVWHPNHADLS